MKYMLDLTQGLRTEIKIQAAKENRSMNELIVKAVEKYLATTKEGK